VTLTRKSRAVVASILAIVLVAGIGVGLALKTSPTPPAAKKLPTNVYAIPKTINDTCAHDVTYAFGKWLLSIPNGTPGHDHIAKLHKGGCYTLAGEIWWRGAQDIVLDGNGATLKQPTPNPTAKPEVVGGLNIPTVNPYCGSKLGIPYMNSAYSGVTSTVLMVATEGGCDLTFENLKIVGTHPKGGDPSPNSFYQPASFIQIDGTQRVLINHVTERGTYGDFVSITGFHEAPGGGGGMPSTDVTIENGNFTYAGRTGISETNGAHRVLITKNVFDGAGLTMFDTEQDVTYPGYAEEDINITGNTITGFGNYGFLYAALTGSEIQRNAFTDNTLTNGAQFRFTMEPHAFGGMINNNFLVAGNTSIASSTWPDRSPVNIFNVYGPSVLVMDNTDPLPTYGGAGRPFANVPKGALACGDVTPTGAALDPACPAVLPVITPPQPAALPQ
jgi:hypothetical protein